MSLCLDRALDEKGIDKNDPLQMDHFRHYIKNLTLGSDRNCLVINLQLIRDKYSDYIRFESEKKFEKFDLEHPELAINIKGKIDKIMFNEEEKKLIVSDFKTGTLKPALLSKLMLSQLYLYLRYCAGKYTEYELKAMYEKLKDPKDTRILEYTLNETEFRQGRQSFQVDEFEKHLHQLFSQIADGKYYITEKDFNVACTNCSYESLCRKNTRIKQ